MPVQGVTVALTTDLAANVLAGSVGSQAYHGILRVIVRNSGNAGTVYLGSSGVTSSGYRLTSDAAPLPLTLYQTETLYAMSTGGAAVIDCLRMNETT